jgi:hypothetical protein
MFYVIMCVICICSWEMLNLFHVSWVNLTASYRGTESVIKKDMERGSWAMKAECCVATYQHKMRCLISLTHF